MAAHSTILARRIPWTEEPSGLQSMGLQRVIHNGSVLVHTHVCPTSRSQPALRGLRPVGSRSTGVRASAPGCSVGVPGARKVGLIKLVVAGGPVLKARRHRTGLTSPERRGPMCGSRVMVWWGWGEGGTGSPQPADLGARRIQLKGHR